MKRCVAPSVLLRVLVVGEKIVEHPECRLQIQVHHVCMTQTTGGGLNMFTVTVKGLGVCNESRELKQQSAVLRNCISI